MKETEAKIWAIRGGASEELERQDRGHFGVRVLEMQNTGI